MSRQHVNAYRTRLANLRARSGSSNEGVVSDAFRFLLERWGGSADLMLVPQWEATGPRGNAIRIDGALVPKSIRFPLGYWEAKDQKDDLAREIAKKIAAGYPTDNIIFEDTREAVLYQNKVEVMRAPLTGDDDVLVALLTRFFAYNRPEIAEFKAAAKQFHADLPVTLGVLREALAEAEAKNAAYRDAAAAFLDHAKAAINPAVTADDVREMLIQHILTEAIFARVFDDAAYHTENNVAQRLMALEKAFFTGDLRHRTTERLKPYYNAITRAATGIPGRAEKQAFLKTIYEGFYKVYNPKAADRLGVVYTPGEIVRFMIRGADWLCEQHFGKCLIDPGVEILDPATGTGTFIVELLEHFAGGGADKLRHKYKEELHANEVAILPYYVANLNIEATYAALTGHYAEFPNLCFVDTLDNTAGLGKFAGYSPDLFGSFSDENIGRIKRQNERKISVIIGNPPYNANQQNENDNNKNRTYARIDARIKDTYIKASTAQKTKLYDMYARFFRWASDRLQDEGIVAFITNRSFIDSRTFDGFRKKVAEDFSDIWVVDLGGDYKNEGVAGRANVFGVQTGVAICFLVRTKKRLKPTIKLTFSPDVDAGEKLSSLANTDLEALDWTTIRPDSQSTWINKTDGFAETLLPVANKWAKARREGTGSQSIFALYSLGVVTARDEWVYDADRIKLIKKVRFFTKAYTDAIRDLIAWKRVDAAEPRFANGIKWSRHLKTIARQRTPLRKQAIVLAAYRPFSKRSLAYGPDLIEVQYRNNDLYGSLGDAPNVAIIFTDPSSQKPWMTLAVNAVADYHFVGGAAAAETLPRYRYLPSGERVDNITDWGLAQFRARYAAEAPELTKDDIFAYVYAALHDPVYRTTYAADLRREFPRIALHDDFARWVAWGQRLLDLHIGYEAVEPFALERVDVPTGKPPLPKLRSQPEAGVIVLDTDTQLTGVPAAAWEYRLGNRSAIDWVLDQHKEKKIKDPTVARLFDTYRFADHKERVIDLLARVVTVSLETVAITIAMAALQGSSKLASP